MKNAAPDSFRCALQQARADYAAALERRDALLVEAESARVEYNRLAILVRSLRDLLGETEPADKTLLLIDPPSKRGRRQVKA